MTANPTNYLQGYVATQLADLDPPLVARLIAKPPAGKASQVSVREIHDMVLKHGSEESKLAWGMLLAEAAKVRRESDWERGWALPISRMIFDLPAPEEPAVADVTAMESRQAA